MVEQDAATPESTLADEIMFDANRVEFANRVEIICSLEAGGHLAPKDAFARIKSVWDELKRSKRNPRAEESSFRPVCRGGGPG